MVSRVQKYKQTFMQMPLISPEFASWDLAGKYIPEKLIGEGSYGSVIRAKEKSTGRLVAIKRIARIFEDLNDGKRVLRELILLKRLRHPSVVQFLEILVPQNDYENFRELYLVQEYAPSDLKRFFSSPKHLLIEQVVLITYNILTGLSFIHSASVWHRDLKPANVLIFPDCSAKICDFGLARSVETVSPFANFAQNSSSQSGPLESFEISTNEPSDQSTKVLVETSNEALKDQTRLVSKTSITKEVPGPRPKIKKTSRAPLSKKTLTSHVVTRWYRAPELILIEKLYDGKIDVWSLGCIFAELLLRIEDKRQIRTTIEHQPFFPGNHCYPLSPVSSVRARGSEAAKEAQDQLIVILGKLGTPSPQDLEFITDPGALHYLRSLPPASKIDLASFFPSGVPTEALKFLEGCLQFNPKSRFSVAECLAHPLFASVRRPEYEKVAAEKVRCDFEGKEIKTENELRQLFIQELRADPTHN